VLINTDGERKSSVIGSHHLLKESFRRGNVAFSREHELNRISLLVHGAVEILAGLSDLDVSLIDSI